MLINNPSIRVAINKPLIYDMTWAQNGEEY